MEKKFDPVRGQSILEVLVAAGVGALFVLGAATLIIPSLKSGSRVVSVQTSSALAGELMNNIRTWTEGDWHRIMALSTSSANVYYLNTTSSPFAAVAGTENITAGSSTYFRYFYVDDAYRDSSGNITSTVLTYDPGAKKVTVAYGMQGNATNTLVAYLTRNRATVFDQTDWSGGALGTGPSTIAPNFFATSTNVDYADVPGSITITATTGAASGTPNIDATNHWAWNDTIGWIDFYNNNTVAVVSDHLKYYASSSPGPIALDCQTSPSQSCNYYYAVANDGNGNLSGWAWNDVYGWISFCGGQRNGICPGGISYQVKIGADGTFSGWAWNDLIGWISFNCSNSGAGGCSKSNYYVKTSWTPTGGAPVMATLDSAIYDTGVTTGVQLNSVLWQGVQPVGTYVQIQVAAATSTSGPWNFTGPGGSTATFYLASTSANGSDLFAPLAVGIYNNVRYFRYRLTMYSTANNTATPRVDDVIVNWSP